MTAAELRALLADVPDYYDVIVARPHWTNQVDRFGQPPLTEVMGHVDIGCEVVATAAGQVNAVPFVLLCIGDVLHAPFGSPCSACEKPCAAKPSDSSEEEDL